MLNVLASSVGKGLFAGFAGTAAMTLSSTLEMKLAGREASDTPAIAAGKVLGVEPRDAESKAKFGNIVHWAYGTAWGAARGLISMTGLRGPTACVAHFAAVWGAAQVMLPALDVAPPATEWSVEQLATDVLHHAVYAAVAGAAYDFIESA